MIKRIQQLITQLSAHPKRLFLIDGLGAFLTAFMLGVVLANFESSFGMPLKTLYFLSFLAGLFCLYSFFCYFFVSVKWRPFLKAIAVANTLYCCLTLGLVFYYYQNLTLLGVVYFLGEIGVVMSLVVVELISCKD
jgi:hypothetical protein